MQPDINKKLEDLEKKIDAIYVSVEKTRKYFFWTMIITIVVLVLPLIAMVFIIPSFISSYTSTLQGLGL
jgi:hypothetical protein